MVPGVVRLIVTFAFAVCASAASAAEEVRRVSANGAEFAYVEAGQGDAVVLVHGGLQDYRFWTELLPRFAQRFRTIAYSRRNHFPNPIGEDGAPDGAGDIHGEDLAAFVAALGLGRVHVVAHSSGAVAALFFATNHPRAVRALALNEPPAAGLIAGTPEGQAVVREFAAGQVTAREAFRARDFERAVRLFVDGVGGPGTFDRRSEADRRMAVDNALAHLADTISPRPRAPFGCEAAGRIAAPTLLTDGERSPAFFRRIGDALERCLPRTERATIPGASHTVPGEAPQAYGEAVMAFLARH